MPNRDYENYIDVIQELLGIAKDRGNEVIDTKIILSRNGFYSYYVKYKPPTLDIPHVPGEPKPPVEKGRSRDPDVELESVRVAEKVGDEILLVVSLDSEKFSNDSLTVRRLKDPTGYFESKIELDAQRLSHDDWTQLMRVGRLGGTATLRVAPIVGRGGGTMKNRAVLLEVVDTVGQEDLFL